MVRFDGIRFDWGVRAAMAATLLLIGAAPLTAGILEILKGSGKKPAQSIQVRAQEPGPLETDPGYAQPVPPSPTEGAGEFPAPPTPGSAPQSDHAPAYSGFSDGYGFCGHACVGCRVPVTCCEKTQYRHARASRRLSGDSFYCDCYPLFGPRYGFYTTCWRRLPEDCRCPILLPPRKPPTLNEPQEGEEMVPPTDEVAPPQALNLIP
jgi:hypothetical protein